MFRAAACISLATEINLPSFYFRSYLLNIIIMYTIQNLLYRSAVYYKYAKMKIISMFFLFFYNLKLQKCRHTPCLNPPLVEFLLREAIV